MRVSQKKPTSDAAKAVVPTRSERNGAGAREKDMSVIFRDVPPGYNWGWFSREDPRMHLQTVDRVHFNNYKVWLERKGARVIEPASPIPAKVLKRLESEIRKRRRHIDGRWAGFMIRNGWLRIHVTLPEVVLTAYPGLPGKFMRKVNLQEWFAPQTYSKIKPDDVFLTEEIGALSVFKNVPEDRRDDFDLTRILWND